MKYLYDSDRTPTEVVERLTRALAERKFGVLHIHDLKQTLNGKGVPFEPECRVLDVCNPQKAAKVLADDIDLNMALPCRVSVFEKDGRTRIGMLSPKALLAQLSDKPSLQAVADEVESVLRAAIEEAAG